MADKEATVYVVDVGRSTGEKHHGREQSDLDWALTYVWDRMTSIMALDRKTTLQGVIAARSNSTANDMGDDPDYKNIAVLQDLKALSMADLQRLQQELKPSTTENGDIISALVVAIHMIEKTCKKLKYIRRIIMITSGQGAWADDNIDEIARKLEQEGIELLVLGIDFGLHPARTDQATKQEHSAQEKNNEELIRRLIPETAEESLDGSHQSRGVFGSLSEAIEELGIPRLKTTRPVPSYKGQLLLGDPANYDDALAIDVERYPRTMIRRPPTASAFVARDQPPSSAAATASSTTPAVDAELALVRNQRLYQVLDASIPDGKKEVVFEELARGYEYGRTAVHVSESDMSILNMETQPGLEIVGFIPAENYEHQMSLSRSDVILAQRANTKAIMALSSLVHALHELSSVAVARFTPKTDKAPELVILAPVIEPDGEYLVDVALPFAEDVRRYRFPPLDRVVLASGKTLHVHRHLPDARLQHAMDAFVESMDLDVPPDDWDPAAGFNNASSGNAASDVFAPLPHRIDQAIRFRATHSAQAIPPPAAALTRYAAPPACLTSAPRLADLTVAAALKKVPPAAGAHARRRAREAASTTLSGLDVGALLARRAPQPRVDPANPVPSFRQMLDTTHDPQGIEQAGRQLGAIIEAQVSRSTGGAADEQVLEEMRVFRAEMLEMEEPGIWNSWASSFRSKVLRGELGGERRELWWKIRTEGKGVSLIEGVRGCISKDEAESYWTMRV